MARFRGRDATGFRFGRRDLIGGRHARQGVTERSRSRLSTAAGGNAPDGAACRLPVHSVPLHSRSECDSACQPWSRSVLLRPCRARGRPARRTLRGRPWSGAPALKPSCTWWQRRPKEWTSQASTAEIGVLNCRAGGAPWCLLGSSGVLPENIVFRRYFEQRLNRISRRRASLPGRIGPRPHRSDRSESIGRWTNALRQAAEGRHESRGGWTIVPIRWYLRAIEA